MPYQITSFRDVATPYLNPVQDHTPVGTSSPYIASIGGHYNRNGSADGRPELQTIAVTGVIWGEDTFMTDDGDGTYVDDGSTFWLVANDVTMLRSQLQALRDQVRKEGVLWRMRLDGSEVREWKTATLTRMAQPQTQADLLFKAHVTCEFATNMANWHAEEAVTFSASAVNGVDVEFVVENAGATVSDAVLTVTRTSGTITNLFFGCEELGVLFTWIGSLGAGDVLVIDEGALTVLKNGVDSYVQFSLFGSAKGWMPIEPGGYTFLVQTTGGNAEIELSLYPQFA